jgi:hypothetical protein
MSTGSLFVDPEAVETLEYLGESCDAARRAVDRLLGPDELNP